METAEIIRFIIIYAAVLTVGLSVFHAKEKKAARPKKKTTGYLVKYNHIFYRSENGDTKNYYDSIYRFTIDGVEHKKKFRTVSPYESVMISYTDGVKDAFINDAHRRATRKSGKVFFCILLAPLLASLLSGILGEILG